MHSYSDPNVHELEMIDTINISREREGGWQKASQSILLFGYNFPNLNRENRNVKIFPIFLKRQNFENFTDNGKEKPNQRKVGSLKTHTVE